MWFVLSLGWSETVKNGSMRTKVRFGNNQLNLVRETDFWPSNGSNDSALLTSLNTLNKSQSSNYSRTGLACLEPFFTVSGRPGDTWHYQAYLFLQLQLKSERKALKGPDVLTGVQTLLIPRKMLAEEVAHGGGWGRRVQERIILDEVLWVTKHVIP